MPTYVYECKTCEKVFEVEQRITADALRDCDCGVQGSLRRLIQPIAVLFNGPGFYVTDSVATTSKKPEIKETPADKPSDSATESPDAKPVAPTVTPVVATETKSDAPAP